MWVRQGRTDAWIAHKIDVSVDELARFKREHDLEGGDEAPRGRPADAMSVPAPEPRADDFEEPDEDEDEDEEAEAEPAERERPRSRSRRRPRRPAPASPEVDEEEDVDDGALAAPSGADVRERDDDEAGGPPRRSRRRGRRGGKRHRTPRKAYEATFDHGGEGYGLWLDPAVIDNPVYSEHWAGHRAVSVTFDAEAITIRRVDAGPADPDPGPDGDE
jgi:hypothetical protein